jgi:5-aminolevulinate synthase
MHWEEDMDALVSARRAIWKEMGLGGGLEWCQVWQGRIALASQAELRVTAGG